MAKEKEQTHELEKQQSLSRRTLLKALAGIPILGVFAFELMEKKSFDLKNDSYLIKELGLEDVHTPIKHSNSAKGDLLRIGMIGFGNRAKQLSNGLGFMHPTDTEDKSKSDTLDDWLSQENLNVAITGICDVFDLNAEKGLATAKNEVVG